MQSGKKSKKNSIEKLRNVLDSDSNKDLPPEDAKYLKALSKRLDKSSKEEVIYTKVAPKKSVEKEPVSLEPKVTVYPREEKKIIEFTEVEEKVEPEEVTFTEVEEDVKELSYEEEDIIEVEKVEVSGPEFIEVKPKEDKKKDEEEEPQDKKALADEGTAEWEHVEPEEKTENKPEPIEDEFVPVFVPVKKAEEKEEFEEVKEEIVPAEEPEIKKKEVSEEPDVEKESKIEIFKDYESIDDDTAVLLYDNGFTTVGTIENATLKDLKKIKGLKRKTAKNIKKEIEHKYEWAAANIGEVEIEEEKTDDIEPIVPGETAEGEITEEQIEEEEDIIEKEVKIEVFKDFESIDDDTAVLLYDNGFTTTNYLMEVTLKELNKIKGLKRKKAKNIKKEIDSKIEESAEVKDIEMGETAEGEVKEEQVEDNNEIAEKEEDLPAPVELSAKSAEWEPTTEENVGEQELPEEEISLEQKNKIEAFKDFESIDNKTAIILYDSGFTTVEEIAVTTIKDLAKIKGIKRKTAKGIKKEIDQKYEWIIEEDAKEKEDEKFIEDKEPEVDEAAQVDEKILDHEPEVEVSEKEVFEEVEEVIPESTDEEDVFKDIKSVDEKIAKLLKKNGVDSIDTLRKTTIKDLAKIKGIKRKIAKEIKKEVKELIEKEKIEESFERGENPFILEDEDEDEWESFDEDKISDSKKKEIKGYRYDNYTLFEKEIVGKSGKNRTVRFFSKADPEDGKPIELPKGYEVKENKKTGVPYLKKKK
jgi:ERCC4-type nuclease